jgi:hypothetical protein
LNIQELVVQDLKEQLQNTEGANAALQQQLAEIIKQQKAVGIPTEVQSTLKTGMKAVASTDWNESCSFTYQERVQQSV